MLMHNVLDRAWTLQEVLLGFKFVDSYLGGYMKIFKLFLRFYIIEKRFLIIFDNV
jgi:hypothetical protein